MAGLQAKTTAILTKAPGNVRADASRIGASQAVDPGQAARALIGLQAQIDQIVKALTQPGKVTEFDVTDTKGSLIAWIGNAVAAGVNYFGGWFKQLYIGGTSPADAVITANQAGNVVINGASITLTKNNVRTTIDNQIDPFGGVQSLTSQDISAPNGPYTEVTPVEFTSLKYYPTISGYYALASLRGVASEGTLNLNTLPSVGVGAVFLRAHPPRLRLTDTGVITDVNASGINTTGVVAAGSGITTALAVYPNNAAAIIGGVPVGGLYRIGGDPDQVCIVH